MIDPQSNELQKRVLAVIAAKLQQTGDNVTGKDSIYRINAIQVLQIAQEKGYTRSDLENACRKFSATPQYGDRVEIANFFDKHEPEKLYPYSWFQKQIHEGANGKEFDVYLLPGCSGAMYRRHDGRKINVGTLVNFGGVAIPANVANGTAESRPSTHRQGETALKNDLNDISANYLLSKIQSLEFELERANRTIERQNAIIERFKLKTGGEYAA